MCRAKVPLSAPGGYDAAMNNEALSQQEVPQPSADERKATLDRASANSGAQGWRIETRSDFQATIAKGN